MKPRAQSLLFVLLMVPLKALAHGTTPERVDDLLRAWEFEPGTVLSLLFLGFLYLRGLAALRRAMPTAPIAAWKILAFGLGYASLILALLSPLHPWGRALFSVHMAQHEILMLVAAPLLVLGQTLIVTLKGLPAGWARAVTSWMKTGPFRHLAKVICNPFSAWLLHGIILWVRHLPVLFQPTIENEWVHALQHLSFFLSAVLFWWAVIHGPRKRMEYGMAVLYMFTTALHSGALGALLTFTRNLWYPVYSGSTRQWGLSPLEDQELGGLIMWVPAGIVYIAAGLALFAAWLRESEQRSFRAEPQLRPAVKTAVLFLALTFLASGTSGCSQNNRATRARQMTGGDPKRGKALISVVGCSACHTIPGVRDARALVGPPLDQIALRSYIGGTLKNT